MCHKWNFCCDAVADAEHITDGCQPNVLVLGFNLEVQQGGYAE